MAQGPQFRVPQGTRARDFSALEQAGTDLGRLPQTLSDVMERQKIRQLQEQLRAQQEGSRIVGGDTIGLSGEQLRQIGTDPRVLQAQQPGQQGPQLPVGQFDVASGQLQQDPSQGEAGMLGNLQAQVQERLGRRKQIQDLDIQKREADIASKQRTGGGISESEQANVDRLANSVLTGKTSIRNIRGRGNNSLANKVLSKVLSDRPDFDVIGNVASLTGAKAEQTLLKGGGLQKQYTALTNATSPLSASSPTPVRIAGITNVRADRALATLSRKNVTPQQIAQAVVDMAAIMHGGAPNEIEIKDQTYGTLKTTIANLATFVTSNPQKANQPEVVKQLIGVINDIKEVDNKVIRDNISIQEESFADLIARDPKRWERMKEKILKTTVSITDEQKGEFDRQGTIEVPGRDKSGKRRVAIFQVFGSGKNDRKFLRFKDGE